MKVQVWEDKDGEWGWTLFDEYGDEFASQTKMLPTREAARAEWKAASEDYSE